MIFWKSGGSNAAAASRAVAALVRLTGHPVKSLRLERPVVHRFRRQTACRNVSKGYIPHAPNVGDREHMSSFHRYAVARPAS